MFLRGLGETHFQFKLGMWLGPKIIILIRFSKLNELMQINVSHMERAPVVSNHVSRQF
jgi:hypothetical protein